MQSLGQIGPAVAEILAYLPKNGLTGSAKSAITAIYRWRIADLSAPKNPQYRQVCPCQVWCGSTERFADARMKNLIGEDVEDWPSYLQDPAARLHLYGKRETRPGRKMGHVRRPGS